MTVTTQNKISITRIQFPEIKLLTRDAHKLRGYFGNLFKEHSPILHNHYEDGSLRYRYPAVQYKVLNGVPTLIGIGEGAGLLPQLFLKIREITLDGDTYPISSKNIQHNQQQIGFSEELQSYSFDTLWMALNQDNHKTYIHLASAIEKKKMLNSIIVGHVLSLFSNMNIMLDPDQRLMAMTQLQEKSTKFKDNTMIAFTGEFVINAHIPDGLGLGKSVSRGFGTVKKM
ncbi:CRISPR-associated endonuclease Cas6 [Algoriphagus sp. NG3]|uniref:CRISPR-associated endonuclease Cas6 n=1 Tax=Algoriphagus sp. NG3 TaxID=3097546 RepID=UPI002A81EBD2|nr:CRISPR-associated endonuclease Cas6 [Algoriphagus sp. NG3]WPR77958.1 CRISPR-associated endonuclease Cas6 [Algoriphagus sp. NG3]